MSKEFDDTQSLWSMKKEVVLIARELGITGILSEVYTLW